MDYLRHSYKSKMRMFVDDKEVLVPGKWYLSPDNADLIPFEHTFSSSVYLDSDIASDDAIGEVPGVKYSVPWEVLPCASGKIVVGTSEVWQQGESISAQGSLVINPNNGLPIDCLTGDCMALRVEGIPSGDGYNNVTTLRVNEPDGFEVAFAGANRALIKLKDASLTDSGKINIVSQRIAGLKKFRDGIFSAYVSFGYDGEYGGIQGVDNGSIGEGVGPSLFASGPGTSSNTAGLSRTNNLFFLRHTGDTDNPSFGVYENDFSGTMRVGAWDTISGLQVCGGLVCGGSVVVSAGDVTGLESAVEGIIGTSLVAGSNVTITPGPGAGQYTLGVTLPTAYTDDDARNAVASVLEEGPQIEWQIGTGVSAIVALLKDTTVIAGEWPVLTVDTKGRATSGRNLAVADLPLFNGFTSGAPIAGDDELPIWDNSTGANGKVTWSSILAQIGAALTPSGTVIMYAGSSTPTGFLACNGSAVSRSTYSALFTAIGTSYGSGDGSTTFNVPDFRGRVTVGEGTGSGLTPRSRGQSFGTETHALTSSENGQHSHNAASSDTGYLTYTAGAQNLSVVGGVLSFQLRGATALSGAGDPHNNVQPSGVVSYCIKT